MNKHTTFQPDWLNEPLFASWLERAKLSNKEAYCKFCKKNFNLSNMGRRAVTSHMNGEKHKKLINSMNSSSSLYCFMKKESKSTTNPECNNNNVSLDTVPANNAAATVSQPEPKPPTRGLQSFIMKDNVTRAEILWAIQTVMTHKSLRTAGSDISLFKIMFSDSQIAQSMQLQRDKVGYLLAHGIAPFFKNNLLSKINMAEFYVIGFDESMNKVAQKQQMDLNIRFWNEEKNEVCTRYLNSSFLGRTTAVDLLEGFKNGLGSLDLKKILQVSMDGPNVNQKFLRDLKQDLYSEPDDRIILDMGSCGLHTLHCAFKSAIKEADWEVIAFLRALYNIFKESPARRAMYTSLTHSTVFPKKFCAIRWVENVPVAQRALDILPNIKIFVEEANKTNSIDSQSYEVIRRNVKNPLLSAQLEFFKTFASDIEPFLKRFQSDIPLGPFLFDDMSKQIFIQMEKIIDPSILEKAQGNVKNVALVKQNMLPAKNVNIGISTKNAIKKAKSSGCDIKDVDILNFKEQCRKGLLKFISKLLERSPLHFKLTRAISCFNPEICSLNPKIAKNRMEVLLTVLLENNWTTNINVDQAMREFDSILHNAQVQGLLKSYDQNQRLDHFWFKLLCSGYQDLLKVAKLVMSLSHGNANIERGFSVNAECIVENMRDELLISQRLVYDHILDIGGLNNLIVDKPLIQAGRNAHSKYKEAMEKRKKEDQNTKKLFDLKRKNMMIVKELQEKKAKLLEEAERKAALLNEEILNLSKV